MSYFWRRATVLGAMVVAFGSGAGCAQERDPINRVQPNALDKSFFIGADLASPTDDPEFYWRAFVVDASASQSLIGVGSWAGVDRIRWDVTEDLLIARKAYQIVKGQDNRAQVQGAPDGTIIAAYKILSHFDIRRAYNPSTGEELNVVEENTSDRSWNERQYMRVDWSTNEVNDPMWFDMFLGKMFGEINVEPIAYYVNDPTSDEAPYFDVADGYFDVTNHYYVSPEVTQTGWTDLPTIDTCALVGLYTGSNSFDCNIQEASVRQSYWKIDPAEHDYEPLELTNAPEDIIGNPGGQGNSFTAGILTPGQQGWDPGYAYPDKLYHRFAHLHNIWKKSHLDAPCGSNVDANANGTADECENAGATNTGSQCDLYARVLGAPTPAAPLGYEGRCTIPYRDRQIKTVGYWINQDTPADLLDPPEGPGATRGAMEEQMYSWNQIYQAAVGFAREVECRRTGTADRDTCHNTFFEPDKVMVSSGAWLIDKAKDPSIVFTLCHNPSRSYDSTEACGPAGTVGRVGDVRKNFIFYWPWDSRAPWGGIANWNGDPLTGEIIGGSATIMGRSATMAAAMQRDTLQVAMGDLTMQDILDGVPADNYARMLTDGYAPEALSKEELDGRVNAVDFEHLQSRIPVTPLGGGNVREQYAGYMARKLLSTPDVTQQSTAQLEFGAIASRLKSSEFEAQLVDSHWLVGVLGMDPATPITEDVMDKVSPLRGMDPGRRRQWRELVDERLRARGACYLENEAPAIGSTHIQGLGPYFMAKYGSLDPVERGKQMYRDLWIEAVKGIGIHEVGHSLGMFHNFAASWDAPNYMPQYWQLRTAEGTSMASCNGTPRPAGDDDTCMGPRYLDPETTDEQGLGSEPRPGILYFGNPTTMEYQLERFDETAGLGPYDLLYASAAYGRVLETIEDETRGGLTRTEQYTMTNRVISQLGDQDIIIRRIEPASIFGSSAGPWPAHYTETARRMKIFDPARDCRDATAEEKALGGWRIVHGKVCAPPPRDRAAWQDFESTSPPGGYTNKVPYWHTLGTWANGGDRVRWVYRLGQASNSYLHVNTSDAGADPYEVTINTVRHFDATYPWRYFRRGNREYYYDSVPARTMSNYLERVRAYHWVVANSNAYFASFGQEVFDVINSMDDWNRPYVVAETDMYNLLARTLMMPQPGMYRSLGNKPGQARQTWDPDGTFGNGFTIEPVDGRYIDEDFNSDPSGGGSWDYLAWMNHAGFYTEKFDAVASLVDSRPTLFTISRENYLDGRNVKINFRDDMPAALDRLVGGILAEDWEAVSPSVPPGVGALAPQMLDLYNIDAPPSRVTGSRILFPNIGYRQQLATVVNTALFARMNTDMGLVNKMRVWIRTVRSRSPMHSRFGSTIRRAATPTSLASMAPNRSTARAWKRALPRACCSKRTPCLP
jgi:hypothetical protein